MSYPCHPPTLARALREAACRAARSDARSGHRNPYPGWNMNDDEDRSIYESAYNSEYERAAEEVRKANEERRREREEEEDRRSHMTPEERAEEKKYSCIGCLIGIVIVYFLFKGCTNLLLSL